MRNKKITVTLWMVGMVLSLWGCGKQDELVFHVEEEQTQSASDTIVMKELETVEQQAEISEVHNTYDHQQDTTVYVHICGAVMKPGVYQMKQDSRLFEVIDMAGGLQEDAASRYVNQARTVIDGEQIVILTEKEVETALAAGEPIPTDQSYTNAGEVTTVSNQQAKSDGTGEQSKAKININTASMQELTTLTGVGESKANLIIQYREDNGGFSSTEEIMNIEGIGEKTYAKFAEHITVQ